MIRVLLIGVLVLGCVPAFATALNVVLVAGSDFAVPYDYTGNGNGFVQASLEINNPHTAGLVMLDVTLTAIGSGDDSVAFSEVGLFVDSNSNGAFDPGADVRYGQVYTAYPNDNGSLTFTDSLAFAPGEVRRFLIVVKMNGAVVLPHPAGFRAIVSAISATGGAPTGVPTGFSMGMSLTRRPVPLRLDYEVTGSTPPYNYDFRLVLDNHDGSWAAGHEWSWLVFGQAAYEQGGTAPFASWVTDSASYPVGPFVSTGWASVTYFVVHYDGPSLGPPAPSYWQPAFVGDQLNWWGTANVFLDEGEMTWSMQNMGGFYEDANLEPAHRIGDYLRVVPVAASAVEALTTETGGGNGFAIGAFDVLSHSSLATLTGVTIAASGSGNDSSAFSDVRLFVDTNGNGAYDPGVDTQFGGSYSAYPSDDGQLTFNGTLSFAPNQTKTLLVVAMLNGSTLATFGQTFNTTVTAISATGNMHSGLPSAVIPGIHIKAPTLALTASATAQNVQPFAEGIGGLGVVACEFMLANNNEGTANLDSITVAAAGSLFDQTDFSYVALFLDSNGNGNFDAGDASVAPAVAAFPSDDGALTFATALTFSPSQSRRFFFVVRLGGTAAVGADFWCRVSALGVSGGTETTAIPGTLVECMNIVSPAPQMAVSRTVQIVNGGADSQGNIAANNQVLSYTLSNVGMQQLDLTGAPAVVVTAGANIAAVNVTVQPATTLAASASTSFEISFTVAGPGAFDFTISIASNDPVNNPYTWTVTGTKPSPGGGGDGGDDAGCSSGETGVTWLVLLALVVLVLFVAARRRHDACR